MTDDLTLHTACRSAKEQWFVERCEEMEDLQRKHQSRLLHEKIKELTDRRRGINTSSSCVNNKDGKMLLEKEEIEKRWVEYIEKR